MQKLSKYGVLGLLILIFEGVSAYIGISTSPSSSGSSTAIWYDSLVRSPFNPPNWTFGVVWPILYLMMAVAVWRIWLKHTESVLAKPILFVFALHMIMNWSWNFVFFQFQFVGGAFLLLVFIVVTISGLMVAMHRVDKPACYLLIPYLAWASFATYLSGYIFFMNP